MPATISRRELIKKFRKPNPHGSGDIHISLWKEILRQAEISSEDWDKV